MWQPEPGWVRLSGGRGAATAGLWRTHLEGREVVIKRLIAPLPGDPDELLDASGPGWWRREADVALDGSVTTTPGLRAPQIVAVQEDAEGITLVQPYLPADQPSGLFVARALGRFAGAPLAHRPWMAGHQLRTRLARAAHRGGWRTLARTSVADVAAHLWDHREEFLARLEALPAVAQHGDPVPGNMHCQQGAEVIALDWGTLGFGPVGSDLGYWSLSAREEFEPLLEAYLGGLPAGLADQGQVRTGARVMAAYTVLGRAEWVLARAAEGEGALAGKFRHPSVSPHLAAVQRQFPQIEALLD